MDLAQIEEVRDRLRYDTPFWAKHCAKIVDKKRQLVPLIASPWQAEFDQALEAQRAAGKPMRAIVLKARQLGFSTWTEAKIAQRVTQLPYQNAVVVAHEVKAAGNIFEMLRRMHANLPTEEQLGLGINIKPEIKSQSFTENGRKYIRFGERSKRLREAGRDEDSIFSIDTAQSPESGRSETRNLVHLSEVAKWPERATQGTSSKMISILNSVPYEPETLVVLEATANGMNHFYRRWVSAKAGADDPDTGETYVAIFVPWWRDPAYAMSFPTPEARERFVETIGSGPYGEKEPEYQELYGLTPEQLMWRRMQIRTQHEDKIELFEQENPATDEEAFIGSGNPVFSGILVARAIKAAEAEAEPVLGTLRGVDVVTKKTRGGTIDIPTRAIWVPDADAQRDEPRLKVWEHPVTLESQIGLPAAERKPEGQYIAAVDVAEGEANTFTAGDFHAIHVLDHVSKRQVAEYTSRIDIHLLPRWVFLAALYYNTALLAVEVNSIGIAVGDPLTKDFRYPRMYRRRKADSTKEKPQELIGWKTDQVTKPLIEQSFGEALQEGTHGLRSVPCARQLTTYVADERGRHGAQAGEHDDLLMAAMIARRVAVTMLPRKPKRGGRPWQPADELTGY